MKFLTLLLLCCVAKDINSATTIGQFSKDVQARINFKMTQHTKQVSAASGGSKSVKVPTAPKVPTPSNPDLVINKPPEIPLAKPKCDLKGLIALLKALFGIFEGLCSSLKKDSGPIKEQCSAAKAKVTVEFNVVFEVTEQISYDFPTCSDVVNPAIKGLSSAFGKVFDAVGKASGSCGSATNGTSTETEAATNGTDTSSSSGSATNGTDTSSGGPATNATDTSADGSTTNGTDTSSSEPATNGTDTSADGSAADGTDPATGDSAASGKEVDMSIKSLIMALQNVFQSMNSVTGSAKPAAGSSAADAVSASEAFLSQILQMVKSLLGMVTSVSTEASLEESEITKDLSTAIDATIEKVNGGSKILGSVCIEFSASLTIIFKSVSSVDLETTTKECEKTKSDITSDLDPEAIENGTATEVVSKASENVSSLFDTIGKNCAVLKADVPAMGGKVDSSLTSVSKAISIIFKLLLTSAKESETSSGGCATNGTDTSGGGSATNGTDTSSGGSATNGTDTSGGGSATNGTDTSGGGSATNGTDTSSGGSATNGTDTSGGGSATTGTGTSSGGSATNGTDTSSGGSANNGTSTASQFSIQIDLAVCTLIEYLVDLWAVFTIVINSLSSDTSVAATTAISFLQSIATTIAFVCFQVISSLSIIFEKFNESCSDKLVVTVTAIGEIDLENDDFETIGEDLTQLLESTSGSATNGTDTSSSETDTSSSETDTSSSETDTSSGESTTDGTSPATNGTTT
ncbi:serine-rich adhesin for platelets-like [Bradysia coprophila]|uniref:serine-rich adhesin for platelets-like n=1 Tax=Bradysia coprophila TaxID=38358 RepID=UPI00187D957B|nr:serine-rich adhesin for platelets-like [Bradysia coprophila]